MNRLYNCIYIFFNNNFLSIWTKMWIHSLIMDRRTQIMIRNDNQQPVSSLAMTDQNQRYFSISYSNCSAGHHANNKNIHRIRTQMSFKFNFLKICFDYSNYTNINIKMIKFHKMHRKKYFSSSTMLIFYKFKYNR